MLTEEVRAFLSAPRIARLATLDDEGYPHVVPIWYGLEGDDIVFMTDRDTTKSRNAAARSKGAVCIGGGKDDDAGYLLRGDLSVYTDEGHAVMLRILYHYEDKARADQMAAEWANDDVVVIRLTPRKITRVR